MAGSYSHCRDDDGEFSFALIENMRDAYEACEMMFHMIDTLAGGNDPGQRDSAAALGRIKRAEHKYYRSVNPSYRPRDGEVVEGGFIEAGTGGVSEAVGDPIVWTATTNLRFVRREFRVPAETLAGLPAATIRFILQQGFESTDGRKEWVDVPMVNE